MIELGDLLQAMSRHGAELAGAPFAREFAGFSHDSRTVSSGDLFVALRTDKADGHDFIADAVARGATGILCERMPDGQSSATVGVTTVRVADTRSALLDWAAFALDVVRPYRIAVAGAVGKSTTCAALVRTLDRAGDGAGVFANGNRNDELGIPLALGGLRPEQKLAVLEVAGSSAAELDRLGLLLRPDVLVLTSAGAGGADEAAVAFRGGLAGLLGALEPGGVLVANGDDGELALLLAGPPSSAADRIVRYGFGSGSGMTVRGYLGETSAVGSTLHVQYQDRAATLSLDAPGTGLAYAALAAIATAVALGRDFDEAAGRLDGLGAVPGRLATLPGFGRLAVIDDTFNASTTSLGLALRTLALFPRPHMVVLGEISGAQHVEALDAELMDRLLALDALVLQGTSTSALGRELRSRGRQPERVLLTYSARDSADAVLTFCSMSGSNHEGNDPDGDETSPAGTVLVKGSDAARMERVVELLLPEGALAREMLVRQDEGWRRRTYLPNERPTWVEVDLEAIRSNLHALQALVAPAEVMAVLKGDAYGHGARWVARTAVLNGATMLGVASLNEALDLRADGIAAPILILGYSPPWQAHELAASDIRATVFSYAVAEQYSRVAEDLGRQITVHIKVDTGMTRLGVLPEEAPDFVAAVSALPGIRVEGIFSHLATADSDPVFAMEQGNRFAALLSRLESAGQTFRYVHMENSAAVLRGLPFAYNLVRVGLALYGLHPFPPEDDVSGVALCPALAFKTRVAQVKCVPAGTPVSYGRAFMTERPSRIAVLPVGYGDGFRRSPAHWGEVLVRGRRAPIAGSVCMDMTMIDVTDVEGVQEGDEVVLIGRQGTAAITVEDVAAALGTIAYEVICQILPRVPRQTR